MVRYMESTPKPEDLAELVQDPLEESKGGDKVVDLELESKHKPTMATNAIAEKPKNDKEKIKMKNSEGDI